MIHNRFTTNDIRKKAQVFLIGALIIALILVALASLLNLAVYSENSASRGSGVAEERSLDTQQNTVRIQQRVITQTTADKYISRSNIRQSIQNSVEDINTIESNRNQRTSSTAQLSPSEYDPSYGIVIGQEDVSRQYQDRDGDDSWRLNSTNKQLAEGVQSFDAGSVRSIDQDALNNNSRFSLNLFSTDFRSPSISFYRVYLYQRSDQNRTVVYVSGLAGFFFNGSCDTSTTSGTITIDYVENTFDGEECPALNNIDSTTDWQIEYNNGDNIEGQYGFMFKEMSQSDVNSGDVAQYSDTSTQQPYYHQAIYESSYEIRYSDRKHNYVSDVTVRADLPSDLYAE